MQALAILQLCKSFQNKECKERFTQLKLFIFLRMYLRESFFNQWQVSIRVLKWSNGRYSANLQANQLCFNLQLYEKHIKALKRFKMSLTMYKLLRKFIASIENFEMDLFQTKGKLINCLQRYQKLSYTLSYFIVCIKF